MINAFLFGDNNGVDTLYNPKKEVSSPMGIEQPEMMVAVACIALTCLFSGMLSFFLFPFFLAFFFSLSFSFFTTFTGVSKNVGVVDEVVEYDYLSDDEVDCHSINKKTSKTEEIEASPVVEAVEVVEPVEEVRPLYQYDAEFIFSLEKSCTQKPVGMPNFKKLVNKAIYCKRNLQLEAQNPDRQQNSYYNDKPRQQSQDSRKNNIKKESTSPRTVWSYNKMEKSSWSSHNQVAKVQPVSGRAWRR